MNFKALIYSPLAKADEQAMHVSEGMNLEKFNWSFVKLHQF